MEIFLRNHVSCFFFFSLCDARCAQDQCKKVIWLNSLPARFKKEILDKLIREDIKLTMQSQYKIFVDFGG